MSKKRKDYKYPAMVPKVNLKRCKKCGVEKPVSEFYKAKSPRDGLQGSCKECKLLYNKKYYSKKENKAKKAKSDRNYYLRNEEKLVKYRKEYYEENRRRLLKYKSEYYQENKERLTEIGKEYVLNNRDIINANCARRRAAKLNATPSWLTQCHLDDIKEIYRYVQETQWLSEEPLEVDHIVPLQGDIVCGLHVPWNLQILTKSENVRKGNKFEQ